MTGPTERDLLTGFLDWDRAVVEAKADGLGRDDALRVATPTGVTVLGLVVHLTWVEQRLFRRHLLGEDVPGSVDESYVVGPDLTVDDALAAYRSACEASRRAYDGLALDTPAAIPHGGGGAVDLRWLLVKMIDETARHLGHLDVLRELTDGQLGDGPLDG